MQTQNKYIVYYFDSKSFNKFQVLQNMEEEAIREFPNQKAEIRVKLNEFGVYIATLVFSKKKPENVYLVNKNSFFSKKKKSKKVSRYEDLISRNNVYGKYKETKNYRPY